MQAVGVPPAEEGELVLVELIQQLLGRHLVREAVVEAPSGSGPPSSAGGTQVVQSLGAAVRSWRGVDAQHAERPQ